MNENNRKHEMFEWALIQVISWRRIKGCKYSVNVSGLTDSQCFYSCLQNTLCMVHIDDLYTSLSHTVYHQILEDSYKQWNSDDKEKAKQHHVLAGSEMFIKFYKRKTNKISAIQNICVYINIWQGNTTGIVNQVPEYF